MTSIPIHNVSDYDPWLCSYNGCYIVMTILMGSTNNYTGLYLQITSTSLLNWLEISVDLPRNNKHTYEGAGSLLVHP